MQLAFLTPIGAVVAAGAVVPLAALVLNERRARRVRRALGVEQPPLRSRIPTALALALVPGLLGLALAQPILRSAQTVAVRGDAQAFYIFDTSDSMRAAGSPGGPTRLERALREAERLRTALAQIPSGVATMTDRVLPDLFPTPDEEVFAATLADSVGVDRPPPKGLSKRATTFAALDTLVGTNFFSPGVRHRLAIVFTDGETAPYFAGDLREVLRQPPRTDFVIVRFWRPDERIYVEGAADPGYRPDAASAEATRQLAVVTSGRAFDERDFQAALAAARAAVGTGPVREVEQGLHVTALARWIALAAAVPLLFLLWRRNLA